MRKYTPVEWAVAFSVLALIVGITIWGLIAGWEGKRQAEDALQKAQATISEQKTEVKVLREGGEACKAQSAAYEFAATQFATFIVALDGGYASAKQIEDGTDALREGQSYDC